MKLLMELLTLPVLGAPRLVEWLARTLGEQAEQELLDKGPILGQLVELQERSDAGLLTPEEHQRQEEELLERLETVRGIKGQ